MAEKPELIARLQVGMAASGECSVCGEVIIVKSVSSEPEPLRDMLRRAFEEHVRSDLSLNDLPENDLSEKPIDLSGNLD
jgi:hypothetical protein